MYPDVVGVSGRQRQQRASKFQVLNNVINVIKNTCINLFRAVSKIMFDTYIQYNRILCRSF